MFRDLPPRARWYIIAVIVLGAVTFFSLLPRAQFSPVLPLLFFVVLSSLTSVFKVQFPITSGSNMSVSYIVDIAALIMRGPHTTMLIGACTGWAQSTFNAKEGNPAYRTLFNMSVLVLTMEASGQMFRAYGGVPGGSLKDMAWPLLVMSVTYFAVNTIPIAIAIALTTNQSAFRIWTREFLRSEPTYVIGAGTAAVVIAVTETSGWWLAGLLTAAPLYLTFKMYRAGVEIEARQGAILEAAHDAILTIDQKLNIREFNPAAEQMFGFSRMNILGKNVELLLPPAERVRQLTAFSRYLTLGDGPLAHHRLELTCIKADGAEFPVELTVARLGTDSRAIITGFVRDLTERRMLEEQLRQSQKLEAVGRLAGGVAHDFNNILMSIMGAADLLAMNLTRGQGIEDEAAEIKRSVQRGASLTRQLLAFSRRQAARPQLLTLGDVVAGLETMLRRLIAPEIEFRIVRQAQETRVLADPSQIEQVVLNLVVNSRDAMPDGGRVTVTVDQVRLRGDAALLLVEGHAGDYARLTVSDTGIGIDELTKAKLFEPFFTTKEHGKGTGLGLSIVYGIVKQSGGYITVVSEPGHGASFVIHLPAASRSTQAALPVLA